MKIRRKTRVRIFRMTVAAALLLGAICAAVALCRFMIQRHPLLSASVIVAVLWEWMEEALCK